MNFTQLVQQRQSCRSFDSTRVVEEEKLAAILSTARLSPSACNGQPYHFSLCRGETARQVAQTTMTMGKNPFAADAQVMLIISEMPYSERAAAGSKIMGNDYRSMDIGIAAAHIILEAANQGLGSCMLGWFDDQKIRAICNLNGAVRLVIAIGYAKESDSLCPKVRKELTELVSQF